jgi:hypothetical protein
VRASCSTVTLFCNGYSPPQADSALPSLLSRIGIVTYTCRPRVSDSSSKRTRQQSQHRRPRRTASDCTALCPVHRPNERSSPSWWHPECLHNSQSPTLMAPRKYKRERRPDASTLVSGEPPELKNCRVKHGPRAGVAGAAGTTTPILERDSFMHSLTSLNCRLNCYESEVEISQQLTDPYRPKKPRPASATDWTHASTSTKAASPSVA